MKAFQTISVALLLSISAHSLAADRHYHPDHPKPGMYISAPDKVIKVTSFTKHTLSDDDYVRLMTWGLTFIEDWVKKEDRDFFQNEFYVDEDECFMYLNDFRIKPPAKRRLYVAFGATAQLDHMIKLLTDESSEIHQRNNLLGSPWGIATDIFLTKEIDDRVYNELYQRERNGTFKPNKDEIAHFWLPTKKVAAIKETATFKNLAQKYYEAGRLHHQRKECGQLADSKTMEALDTLCQEIRETISKLIIEDLVK